MKTNVLLPSKLSDAQIEAWNAIIDREPALRSPFLSPNYIQALEAFCPRVRVAVLEDADGRTGFFPFEAKGSYGHPLGMKLADFQGVVAPSELAWTERDLLDASGMSVISFDHLLGTQASRFQGECLLAESPRIDLSKGFDHYFEDRKACGSTWLTKVDQKHRKLLRDHPSLEFQWNDPGDDAFELMLTWKTEQRRRTNTFNILDVPWVPKFLGALRKSADPTLSCVFSTMRIEGKVVAVHFGLRGKERLHYWFPSYSQEFSNYSTGLILLAQVAREAPAHGICQIDLGKGDDPYKSKFATDFEQVATVFADRSALRRALRESIYRLGRWMKNSPFRDHLRNARQFFQRWTMGCLLH